MKKTFLSHGETTVDENRLRTLERKALAHDDYLSACQYMTGYLQKSKEILDETDDAGLRQRMKGRLEAVSTFDRAIMDRAWRRGGDVF